MNKNTLPLASIIVLNWNNKEDLAECLSSLLNQSYINFEIIVVDNNSTDNSVEFVRNNYANSAKLITLEKNVGFGKGNNIGIEQTRGVYILLLNNDCVTDKFWIEKLVKAAEQDQRIGMCASKILSYYNRKVIDNTGHLIYPDGLNWGRGRMEVDNGQYDKKTDIFFPSGCAALYRKDMFKDIGNFDEDFFAYGDDAEIGIRARLAGWKCVFVPTAIAYHKFSKSTSSYSKFKAYLVERNRIWVAAKCFPGEILVVAPYFTLKRYFWHVYAAIFKKGVTGKFIRQNSYLSLFWIFLKANIVAWVKLPKMLYKRQKIKQRINVKRKEIISWFKQYAVSAKELALKELW